MYPLNGDTVIDLDQELAAVVNFLSPRWSGIAALTAVLKQIRDEAVYDGRAWFDSLPAMTKLQKRIERRETLLKWLRQNGSRMAARGDLSMRLLSRCVTILLGMKDLGLDIDGPWNLESRCRRLHEVLLERHSALGSACPRQWHQLQREFVGQFDMRLYAQNQQRLDEAAFTGHCATDVNTLTLPVALSPPSVIHDEVTLLRPVSQTLVAVVYRHFLVLAKHRNTRELVQALESLNWKDSEQRVVTELPLESSHPLAKAVLGAVALDSSQDNPLERTDNALETKRRARLKLLRQATATAV